LASAAFLIATGLFYALPLPVQPMKAISAGGWPNLLNLTHTTTAKCTRPQNPVDLPLRLDDAAASPTTPQGQTS